MWNKKSISFQIIMTVVMSFPALFLFFSILTTRLYYKNVADIMQESQQHSLTQLNESFDTFYQQIIYILIQLSGDSSLKQYLTKKPEDTFEYYRMQQYVHDFLQTYTGFFPNSNIHLILYGENGQTYTTYNETLHLEHTGILDEDFVKQAERNHRRIGISYFYPGLTPYTENENYIYFAHALYDPYRSRYYVSPGFTPTCCRKTITSPSSLRTDLSSRTAGTNCQTITILPFSPSPEGRLLVFWNTKMKNGFPAPYITSILTFIFYS